MKVIQQQLEKSMVKPKKAHQPDKYEGQLDSYTKQRHGKGIYRYDTFFTYEGNYVKNKKQGPGILRLANGTTIQANFVNDEIEGDVVVKYGDGSTYKGQMKLGQKHGIGQYKSMFQSYKGQWIQNKKSGAGVWETTSFTVKGQFLNNKIHGEAKITKWDGYFEGAFENGKKKGHGKLLDHGQNVMYEGNYQNDLMNGHGKIEFLDSKYTYIGQFRAGSPVLIPNQFDIGISYNKLEENGRVKSQVYSIKMIEYQIEGDSFNIQIKSSFQGPEILDQNQPSAEEIEKLQKAWQAENKKNKNPPPMPDFSAPKMKKPSLILVKNQSSRLIGLELVQHVQGKEEKKMRLDYRQEILKRKIQIQNIKKQNMKKNEEEIDKKKAPKKQTKGQQPELKVNLYKEEFHQRHKITKIMNKQGVAQINNLELPDDFPIGKYHIRISNISKHFIGQIPPVMIQLNVLAKGSTANKNIKKK